MTKAEAAGMHGLHARRDVDGSQHPPRGRLVDRRRDAGPPLRVLGEVLRREDLDRMVGGEGGADCVRARRRLGEPCPGDEVHLIGGGRAHAWVALDPEQHPVRVRHAKNVLGRARDGRQRRLEDGGERPERVLEQPLMRVVLADQDRGEAKGRIGSCGGRALPRLDDRHPDTGRGVRILEKAFAREAKLTSA
jgi:hypothetical protein